MNKQDYREAVESIKLDIKKLNGMITDTEQQYIEDNKPCDLGENVQIVLGSDRVVKGIVASIDILKDATVCITSYNVGNNTKYITTPHKEVTIINS